MMKSDQRGRNRRFLWRGWGLLLFLAVAGPGVAQDLTAGPRIFQARGVVRDVDAGGKTVTIAHEAVPGYMPAMTMPFAVKDAQELKGIGPGDAVAFDIMVTATDGWIGHLRRLDPAMDTNVPTTGPFRMVRDVEPLDTGQVVPDGGFTNELGRPVRLADFRGQGLAITFVFTRCPYPNFCPRMASRFHETLELLGANPHAPTNYHFLTVSFDPEFDTPGQLKAYAEFYHYDPARWSFLTGRLIDITALADGFGMKFWRDGAGISHNLRTAVVDARGRLQRVFPGNEWTAAALAAEMEKAAKRE